MDISSALQVLRDAKLDALWEHRQEIEITLSNISRRLRSTSPSTNSSDEPVFSPPQILDSSSSDELFESESNVDYHVIRHGPERRHVGNSQHGTISEGHGSTDPENSQSSSSPSHTRSRPQAKDWSSTLLAAAADDLPWLCTFLSQDPAMILDERTRERKDERIRDIQLVEGNDHAGRVEKIFRGLAQRSMGLQFTQIQRNANAGMTRVDELCDSICATDLKMRARIQRRTNSISKHLHHFTFSPDDRELVLRSINHGVKQLVVERLFERRLRESGRPSAACGISAFAALNMLSFKSLRFEDIPRFIDLLFLQTSKVQVCHNSTAPVSWQVGTFQVADILTVISPRFSVLQRHYNRSRSSTIPQDFEPASQPEYSPEYLDTVLLHPPVHQTSVSARPIAPSSRPSKRRRLKVSATSQPSSHDRASANTQPAEPDSIRHSGNQLRETNPTLSHIPDALMFSQSTFPTPGYYDVTQVVNYDQVDCGFNDINQLLGEGVYFNVNPYRQADPEGYGFCDVTHAVQDYTPHDASFVDSIMAFS
ncbi:hypothetical protein ACMYSQ_012401 [Aspergillus niger]